MKNCQFTTNIANYIFTGRRTNGFLAACIGGTGIFCVWNFLCSATHGDLVAINGLEKRLAVTGAVELDNFRRVALVDNLDILR